MIRLLIRNNTFLIRSKKTPKINPQQLQEDRKLLVQHFTHHYSSSDRPYEDRVYQQVLYGRKCNIVGLKNDSQQSTTFIATVFQTLNPDLVIMGGFNNSKLLSQKVIKTIQQKRTVRSLDSHIQPSKLYCKSLIVPILTRIMQQNPNYVQQQKSQSLFRYDHKNKHIHALNYLTIVNKLLYRQYCKLTFGKPSDYIIFQDIMINQSIQNLRQIFDRVVKVTKDGYVQNSKQNKSIKYYPDLIMQQIRYNAIIQQSLNKKQLTYITALLNKSITVSQRAILFVQYQHVHQIADNVHKIRIDPKQVFRGGFVGNIENYVIDKNSQAGTKINNYLNTQNKQQAINQLIEKLVILNCLKNDTLQIELLNQDQNIFKKMIFWKLFNHLTIQQIKQKYITIKKQYDLKIGQIIQQRIKNIMFFNEQQKNYYTLSQMIKTQQQRNIDFPIQMKVQNKNTIKQQQIDMQQILNQVDQIIKKQLTYSQRQMMEAHKNQQVTRQSIVLYQKLLVQAKIRLGKSNIKLPVFHYGAMSAILKDKIKQQLSNKLSGKKKSEKKLLLDNIDKLKQKGIIKQIANKDQFQRFEKQAGGQSARLSLDVDDKSGNLSIHDENNPQQIQNMLKNSQIFRQLFEMTEKTKDQQTFQESKEEDQIKSTQNKTKQTKKGRKHKNL